MEYHKHPFTGYKCLTQKSWGEGSEIHSNFSPLGSFLARLYRKLARTDPTLLPLASFYTHALSTGQGGGEGGRFWTELSTPDDIWNLSVNIRRKNGHLGEGFSFLGF